MDDIGLPTTPFTGKKILIIDDQEIVFRLCRLALSPSYEILSAPDGMSALRLLEHTVPDLILLDILMPGMNGFDVFERIRQSERLAQIPVVFITAQDDHESLVMALRMGAADFILKPFNMAVLRHRLNNILERDDLRRKIATQQRELQAAHQREIETASIIQHRLLFGEPPKHIPGLNIASYSEASMGIDGDFYAFTEIGADAIEIITGDVMGKGVLAAMIGAGIKSSYRALVTQAVIDARGEYPDAARIVNQLHREITPQLIQLNTFVTMSLLRIDRRAGTLTWVNAGHTPLLLASGDQPSLRQLSSDNLPLGVLEDEVYAAFSTPLTRGDTLMSYSDGITEACDPDGKPYGDERLNQLLRQGKRLEVSAYTLLLALRSDLANHVQHNPGQDDCTAIVVQLHPTPQEQAADGADGKVTAHFEIERRLDCLTQLRAHIADFAGHHPEQCFQALILAAFEAATNVVRHAPEKLQQEKLSVTLECVDNKVSVELFYAGDSYSPGTPPAPNFSGQMEGGFGLFIMENSVDRVLYSNPLPGLASIRLEKLMDQAATPAS